ncbi:MAG: hypothetical protein ACFE0J_09190 [Elainellaceae cyanobacterium]
MTYQENLKCWAIVRTVPNTQEQIVNRFRRRSDAEGHAQLLRQRFPRTLFAVVFDRQAQELPD